jgi:hypothetical protein
VTRPPPPPRRTDDVAHDDINEAAVDRLVARASAVLGKGEVRSAFSGTRGLAPTMVATVAAVPAVIVVIISLVISKPALLLVAIALMALVMVVIMTKVNATRVVVEARNELVVLSSRRGELAEIARLDAPLVIEPGGGAAWLLVRVGDEKLWVSRPAFGGIVNALADAA